MFGTQSAIDKTFEMTDKAFYTKQERDEFTIKAAGAKVGFIKAIEPFKLTQRVLAMSYCIPYMTAWTVTFIASFFTDMSDQKEFMVESEVLMANMIILGFYFGGGFAEGIITKFFGVKNANAGGKK